MNEVKGWRVSRVIRVLVVLCLLSAPAEAQYSGGSGTAEDPFQIATAEDLMLLGGTPEDYNKHFVMTADIDLDPNLPGRKVFDGAVIAPDTGKVKPDFQGTPFAGFFDGNGHTVSNLTVVGKECLGLFGQLGSEARICNLGMEAAHVSATRDYVGALAGNNCGSITFSYCTGTANGGLRVGGLVGKNYGSISRSYSAASIIGHRSIGGLAGSNEGSIINCYSASTVNGGDRVGGLVGCNGGRIASSYSTGTVEGDECVGGLAGWIYETGAVTTSYSRGMVTANEDVGGLVGYNEAGSVSMSFWDMESSGLLASDGGVGLTTAEMTDPEMAGLNGLADDPNWVLDSGEDYPRLAWEDTEGKPIVEPVVDWMDGDGTAETPYEIADAAQLARLSKAGALTDRHFVLVNDLDLGGLLWFQAVIPCFSGSLDGNGFCIRNFTLEGGRHLGLIGVMHGGVVTHLGLEGITIEATGDNAGGLVGGNYGGGSIERSYSTGTVSGREDVGGLVGANIGSIGECHSSCTTSGSSNVGGLAGMNFKGGSISASRSSGEVTGSAYVGGLVGASSGEITASYSTGTANGGSYLGGLVGKNNGSIGGSYSTARVIGDRNVGGLVGHHWYGAIIAGSYSTGTVRGYESIGGLVGLSWGYVFTSYSAAIVSGDAWVGGLSGWNDDGSICSCCSTGTINGNTRVGGLAGWNTGLITASYSTGTVDGSSEVGGLVGDNWHGSIAGSYSTGAVNGNEDVGGLVGDSETGTVTTCFWDTETSGQTTSAAGTGLTTVEMQNPNNFLIAGWDFVDEVAHGMCDYWQMTQGDYPRLRYLSADGPAVPEGLGTAEEPYLIQDVQDLCTVWSEPLACYRLGASLDLSEITWSMAVVPWFAGTFDGNGHAISGLHIEGGGHLGLFGHLALANISDLGLEAINIEGTGHYVGGLTGWNSGGIGASYSTGSVSGSAHVGGVAGRNLGSISESSSTGTVSGDQIVGGLVGQNQGDVERSYSTAIVTGTAIIGGLVGENPVASVTASYSRGRVVGERQVGGLAGENAGAIIECYSAGTVSGDSSVGGLVGNNFGCGPALTILSFWDVEASGQSEGGGGTAKTTAQMRWKSTFGQWDFAGETANGTEDIWAICEGTNYPRFVWQIPAGDLACPDGVTMVDFSVLAERWLDEGCGVDNVYCAGADIDLSGAVDGGDLEAFAESWLEGVGW